MGPNVVFGLMLAAAVSGQDLVRSTSTAHKCDVSRGGYYTANPDDCRAYFVCDTDGNLYDGDCGPNGAFDPATVSCRLANQVASCSRRQTLSVDESQDFKEVNVEYVPVAAALASEETPEALKTTTEAVAPEPTTPEAATTEAEATTTQATPLPTTTVKEVTTTSEAPVPTTPETEEPATPTEPSAELPYLDYGDLELDLGADSFPGEEESEPEESCKDRPDGLYNIKGDCGRYIQCSQGLKTTEFCPETLSFDEEASTCVVNAVNTRDECSIATAAIDEADSEYSLFHSHYGIEDDYDEEKEEDRSIGFCRNKANGAFMTLDRDCYKFYLCEHGAEDARTLDCPTHLIYDGRLRTCVGVHTTNRQECLKDYRDRVAIKNGFICAQNWTPHPIFQDQARFSHPDDCAKFFVCHRNNVQTPGSCPAPKVFDERTGTCRHYKLVRGCESYYDQ